jgi:ATP-binding protein involved in chromosome partitioning
MKIAIPVADGRICAHFGHSEQFALIEVEDNEIKSKEMLIPPAHEPGVLPRWLHEQGANVIITGGMGQRAQMLFAQNDIKVIYGVASGEPEELVRQYLNNTLDAGDNICDH